MMTTEVVSAETTITGGRRAWSKFGLEALDGTSLEDRKWRTKASSQEERLLPPKHALVSAEPTAAGAAGARSAALTIGGASMGVEGAPEAPKKLMLEICRCLDLLGAKDVKAETLAKAAQSSQRAQEVSAMMAAGLEAGAAFGGRAPMLRKPDQDDQTVRVTNLPDFVTQEVLEVLFNRIGDVQRTFLVRNKETHVSRGFAFITYRTRADAQKAIDKLNGRGFMGSVLTVECARRKAE